jgi:hypothetical protein
MAEGALGQASRLLELNPAEINYPAGLYRVQCEQRAIRDYMRPKSDHEIACGSELTRRLSRFSKKDSPIFWNVLPRRT